MPTFGGVVLGTGGEGTARRAFSDVIDELARPVNSSDDTVRAYCADAFRAAVRIMNRKGNWPWELMDEEITIDGTNAQGLYTVSGPVKKNLAMHYLTATGGLPQGRLGFISYERFVEQYDLSCTGRATDYTVPNFFELAQVRFFPIPTGLDYAKFTYYRVTPEPRDEAETIEIPDWATEVYMSYAWVELCKRSSSHRAILPIPEAIDAAKTAFRELSAQVTSAGDRVRSIC